MILCFKCAVEWQCMAVSDSHLLVLLMIHKQCASLSFQQRVHEVSGGEECPVPVKRSSKRAGTIDTDDLPSDGSLNLGALFMEFLQLYGSRFNYENVGISVRDGGYYFRKAER